MPTFKCSACGTEEVMYDPAVTGLVNPVLNDGLRARLNTKFTSVSGSEGSKPHTTLFLSRRFDIPLGGSAETPAEAAARIFGQDLLPVLEVLDENFTILGTLAAPSYIKLAMTELREPYTCFAFVTVADEIDLKGKLSVLGLSRLLEEGSVDTVSTPIRVHGSQASRCSTCEDK